ncbi:hypothetical protein HGRIS_014207 [Hohenbuehelia grisea]|uniref:Uncharacterized protein n=1 Tax=Hohenbuehelia grisea TaxID=104357 RepID=A0ABR3JUR9_9AGAR
MYSNNILRFIPKPVYCQQGQKPTASAPYYGFALYSQTLAAFLTRIFGQQPSDPCPLDHFIALLVAQTRAPCAAGVAAVILMDAVQYQKLPSCGTSIHLRFFACLRVVLEHIYRRSESPHQWATYQPLVDIDRCTRINIELLDALRFVLNREDAERLTALTSRHESDDFAFELSPDGKTYSIRDKYPHASLSPCSDATSFVSSSEDDSASRSHWSDDEDDADDAPKADESESQPTTQKRSLLSRLLRPVRPSRRCAHPPKPIQRHPSPNYRT